MRDPGSPPQPAVTQERTTTWGLQSLDWGLLGLRVAVLGVVIYNLNAYPIVEGLIQRLSQIATSPGVPYRDFQVEYMPGDLLAIFAVAGKSLAATGTRLAVGSFALDVGVFAALRYGWGRVVSTRYLLFGVPLLVMMYLRLDFLTVFLCVLGFALTRKGRERSGGLVLGLAILTKVWPLVLLPVLLLEHRRKALLWTAACVAAGALVWLGIAGFAGPRQVATFRGATGWSVESGIGVVVALVTGAVPAMQRGSLRVGRMPPFVGSALFVATLGLCAILWRRARGWSGDLLGAPALGALALLLILSPLFSVQYAAWLLPWLAVAWGEDGSHTPTLLALVAVFLTACVSLAYNRLALTSAELLLLFRNAMILAMAVWWFLPGRRPVVKES